MKTNSIVATPGLSRDDLLKIMKENEINQIPIVDGKGFVIGLELLSNLIKDQVVKNWVIVMAGGLGTRLNSLTDNCPKPLLKVGDKPLLETIMCNFVEQGFKKFYFTINYKGEMIKEYFGDGSRWGVSISYIIEEERLGTAGALGLLLEKPEKPLLVMNGDLLTKTNYKQLLDFHQESRAVATMCVREYSFQIPYGIVKLANNRLQEINEKPVHHFFVNAGIYVLEPEVLDMVPYHKYLDMTTLFTKMIKQKKETAVFPIREYWIDIGYYKDYEKANNEFDDVFLND